MSQLIQDYIKQIQSKFDAGGAREHTYRPPLEKLLLDLSDHITVTNEHERVVGVGMPDLTIKSKKNNTITIGRIEAKDLHINLDEKNNADQLKRYKDAFDNFIYTNNLTFNFYRHGKLVESVSLGTATKKEIIWLTTDLFSNNIIKLERLLKDFLSYQGQTITSPEKLAKAMAQKAQLIKYAIESIFAQEDTSLLQGQYEAFKGLLVHDLTEAQFADMYAQTIAYGLFTARLYDPTLPTFSREEAEKLIPKSTPFIRRLFKQMASDDEFDDRIAHIIDDLVHIFLHCNVEEILRNYGKKTKMEDPIIHFYETFLGEYDSNMRKKRGVYYTPEPVVKFIVRGVDYLLKTEFGLKDGLADTSKVEAEFRIQAHDKRRTDGIKKEKRQVHRVQVLDPATGTGTFLNEVIHYIYENYFQGQQGIWKNYVSNDLLPRIWGFEILMASYTMAHLKLGMTLADTGWHDDKRVNIYLTNSLEEPHDNLGTLFSQALAKESEQASQVKREQPIMVVIGNPPYSVSSSNKGEWIENLTKDYKKGLIEKSYNSLSDDYVKFIRFAEHFIEKNNEGILAYITNNSYLDGISFRVMREKLMKTFDKIYIVNLHGDVKKKETTPEGGKDENVFDIQQGTAIIFGVKNSQSAKCEVSIFDLYGKRKEKYSDLSKLSLDTIRRKTIQPNSPDFFYKDFDYKTGKKYQKNIPIDEIFTDYSSGVKTHRDHFIIDKNSKTLSNKIITFFGNTEQQNIEDFSLKNSKDFQVNKILSQEKYNSNYIFGYSYRPLSQEFIYYDSNFIDRDRKTIGKNMLQDNISIIFRRRTSNTETRQQIFCSKYISDINFLSAQSYFAPLYLYNDDGTQRKPNLDQDLIDTIIEKLGATRTPDGQGDKKDTIGPEDIFDYIYAVLHSPTYRETYQEFLKTDFPRIPFVEDKNVFWQLVELGNKLRTLHLMEGIERADLHTSYPVEGDDRVEKIGKKSFVENKVFINETQHFDGVSDTARNFRIGGYQPAQKWLKDRQGEKLSYDDIMHYQKIIYILERTDEIMKEIDTIDCI